MEDATRDLIEQLLVAAAGIMEDASAAILAVDGQPISMRVALLRQAGVDLTSLGEAGRVLVRSAQP